MTSSRNVELALCTVCVIAPLLCVYLRSERSIVQRENGRGPTRVVHT